ncbi:LacI family DNA-binding transcriptional regulator [Glycomyces arizonensis]|uniref:LacI family DNA-binding transcriptional regulator n=1 Tax=Glycomyces arizonensis TaxID=256035 RepID=UPI000423C00C|nr:LacI family DNA-binding transcriptional regulator [Glycomyces arizonensis]
MARPTGSRGARTATLSDVAKLAGVSVATASKALNNRNHVHAQTRARVLDAAAQLSFSPNSLARGLLAGRSGTVGLLTSDLVGRFSLPILMGAEDAFGAGQVSVFLCDARGDAIRERHHVQALVSRRVDGLIVVGSSTDPRPALADAVDVPVVYAYAPSEDPDDLSIVPDNVEAGRMAVEHLIACGRTRIAHISGDRDYSAARDRVAGATAALEEAGLEPVGQVSYGTWSEGWGRAAAGLVLDRHPEVDAVLCGSDQVARGVLDTLRERGRAVPDDVAVMGFDNWEVLTVGARPQLTSVDMNLEELGRAAARALFDAIDDEHDRGVQTMQCRIVIRGSTAPLN